MFKSDGFEPWLPFQNASQQYYHLYTKWIAYNMAIYHCFFFSHDALYIMPIGQALAILLN